MGDSTKIDNFAESKQPQRMKRWYRTIKRFLTDTVFRLEHGELSGAVASRLVATYKLLFYTLRGTNTHRTMMQSAALTLYTTFAVIPILALAFVVVHALGGLQPLVMSLYSLFPDSHEELDRLLDFAGAAADNMHGGVLAGFGVVTLLWAVFRVFDSVEAAFNTIWEVPRRRKIIFRYPAYLAVALVVPALWGLSTSIAYNAFAAFGLDSRTHFLLTRLISLAVACLATSLLYKYIPHTKVRLRNAWRAGVIAGVVLALWQWGYVYVQGFMSAYNAIYGSFAALPLFIIWLQVSWQIVLLGCELSFAAQNMARFDSERRSSLRPLAPDGRDISVVVVGSGNVAESFAMTLSSSAGVELRQIFARNPMRGSEIAAQTSTAWTDDPARLALAEIYIIAVSDKAIAEVAASLPFPDDAIVVHTAGSMPLRTLPDKLRNRGILYALQSFTSGRRIDLAHVPIFIEADSDDVRQRLFAFARMLSTRVDYADSERRRVIHLAGVLVNNFPNHLYGIAARIVEREGLSFDILRPLIMETAEKAVASPSPDLVQTGPAVRGDGEVCGAHMHMLEGDPLRQKIYNDITESIWETSKRT